VKTLETWTDASVGETRQALVRDGRPIALSIWRWSDRNRRARWGETYVARVRSVDSRLRGAFLDLGIPEAGFVRLDANGRARVGETAQALAEGQAVTASVRREGARGKAAVLQIVSVLPSADSLGCVARHESHESADAAGSADADTRDKLDAAFEAVLAREALVVGGGRIIVEPTAALVAIDVDAGERQGSRDPEQFAAALNVAAAQESLRQLRLRNLGGLVAIDFVSMRSRGGREATMAALRIASAEDPWGVTLAPMSRFGIVELSRGQLRQPLAEVLCKPDGTLRAETSALAMLRGIEREARLARGKLTIAHLGTDIAAWLDTAPFDWRSALTARIGPRWEVRGDRDAAPGGWRLAVE
jgi:Ribonuclease G/E